MIIYINSENFEDPKPMFHLVMTVTNYICMETEVMHEKLKSIQLN